MIHCIIYGEQEKHTWSAPGYTVPPEKWIRTV